jgi:hypothetical protein
MYYDIKISTCLKNYKQSCKALRHYTTILLHSTVFISMVLYRYYLHTCLYINTVYIYNEPTDVVIEHSVIEITLTVVVDGIIINGYTNHLTRPLHRLYIYIIIYNYIICYVRKCSALLYNMTYHKPPMTLLREILRKLRNVSNTVRITYTS